MLEVGLEPGEDEAEAAGRVGHFLHQISVVSSEARFRDANQGGAVGSRREDPFDGIGASVTGPLDQDSSIRLDLLDADILGEAVTASLFITDLLCWRSA